MNFVFIRIDQMIYTEMLFTPRTFNYCMIITTNAIEAFHFLEAILYWCDEYIWSVLIETSIIESTSDDIIKSEK